MSIACIFIDENKYCLGVQMLSKLFLDFQQTAWSFI